ncbi:MAG: MFS transporter [Verrucomicrobiales bacterium]
MAAAIELTQAERHSSRSIVIAQSCSKLADVASSAKTVLTWLMGSVGAPPGFVGLLVPIRESGSMLPQAFLSGLVKRSALRKRVFVIGAVGQALALGAMALCSLMLNGLIAGVAIVGLLVVHALSRCLCSIASKDVLGKAVPKGARGRVSGIASAVAGLFGLGGALVFMFGIDRDASRSLLAGLLFGGGVLYVLAAVSIATVNEEPSSDDPPEDLVADLWRRLAMVWTDKVLRKFVIARSLLLGSALGSPYIVVLSQSQGQGVKALAAFVFAGGLASTLSAVLWGKLSDRSSRSSMALGGAVAALMGLAAVVVAQWFPEIAASRWTWPLLFFLMSTGYEGVRIGRKTYVVDISEGADRTDYVSASNTIIAIVLLGFGAIGALLQVLGPTAALLMFSVVCLLGSGLALRLKCATS